MRLQIKLQVLKLYHCYTLADEYENYPGSSVCFSVFKINQSKFLQYSVFTFHFLFRIEKNRIELSLLSLYGGERGGIQ